MATYGYAAFGWEPPTYYKFCRQRGEEPAGLFLDTDDPDIVPWCDRPTVKRLLASVKSGDHLVMVGLISHSLAAIECMLACGVTIHVKTPGGLLAIPGQGDAANQMMAVLAFVLAMTRSTDAD